VIGSLPWAMAISLKDYTIPLLAIVITTTIIKEDGNVFANKFFTQQFISSTRWRFRLIISSLNS